MARYDADPVSNYLTTIQVGAQELSLLFSSRISISLLVRFYQILSKRLSMTLDFVCQSCWVRFGSQTGHQALSDLIKAERDLFKTWWRQGHQGVHTFSQLYLWSMGERLVDLKAIKECLHQMILDQDQIQEIVLSLWENSAVLTKTAQQLYLHRNSLQYKIDKWEELTGLQLKELLT